VAGDEVVELYLTQPKAFETPLRVLAGFQRVHLASGASAHVRFTIDPRSLGQVDRAGKRVIVPGEYAVSVGGGQPQDASPVQTAKFNISGTAELPK
jgi:beta-glucosidase